MACATPEIDAEQIVEELALFALRDLDETPL
jgi:hypothetical protein